MIKFLQKKYKLILLIVATLACVLFSSTVYAWESPNHEQFKMSQFKQSQSTDGGTDTEDLYTIESIIFNKIPFLDPNIFSNKFEEKWKDKDGNEHDYDGYVKGSINYFIKTEITKWYVTMRNLVAAVVIIMN